MCSQGIRPHAGFSRIRTAIFEGLYRTFPAFLVVPLFWSLRERCREVAEMWGAAGTIIAIGPLSGSGHSRTGL